MTGAVIIAVVGVLSVSIGAALQERSAMSAPTFGISQFRLLGHLSRNPVWLAGTLLTVLGVAAHMWALGHAPLVLIQPIGMSGLLFAVMLSAFLARRPLTPAQVFGCLAVTAALIGLLSTLPVHAGTPELEPAEMTIMPLVCVVVMLACVGVSRVSNDASRAWLLALGGGVAYGVASALARVIGVSVLENPLSALQPLTFVALAIGLGGGLIVQNSYRTDHFALAYATLLISDPLTAIVIGVAFLGERLPTDPVDAVVASVAAIIGAIGVITLARSSARRRRGREEQPVQPVRAALERAIPR